MTEPASDGTLDLLAERVTAVGTLGVVAAGAPVAASIGAAALLDGGNAFDAVVSAALAETVLMPPKCGLAGDLVALVRGAGDTRPRTIVAVGSAPIALEHAVQPRGSPSTGGLSVGVPGAPAGYLALARRGRRPLTTSAAPAIRLARDGFIWSRVMADLTKESAELLRSENPRGTAFLPDGEPVAAGKTVRLPGLASVLETFVARGADLFDGPIGDAIVAAVAGRGGVLSREDLGPAPAGWTDAPSVEVADLRVWATPEPSHGPSLLAATADPRFCDGMGGTWDAIDDAIRARATLGDRGGGTSIVSAADREGNAVVVLHSNSFPHYGSGIVVPGYDLILSNRAGRGFTAVPGHPNAPAAGRRPMLTLHAWAAERRGTGELMLGGTPGGENQMPWNAQVLRAVIAGSWEPGRLVTAPRWGRDPETGEATVEEGSAQEVVAELRSRTTVRRIPRWGLRSGQHVMVCGGEEGPLVVAADPRTGGAAVGA